MSNTMKYPFVRVGVVPPGLQVAQCHYNAGEIKRAMTDAAGKGVRILTLPELSITGYTCGDLFFQSKLLESSSQALLDIVGHSKGLDLFTAVGLPMRVGHKLFNCAVGVCDGRILGVVPKTYLPNNRGFYEKRWFHSAVDTTDDEIDICGRRVPFGTDLIFKAGESIKIGIEICDDLWSPIPPSSFLAVHGANIILNLSASDELAGKSDYRRSLVTGQSARTYSVYCYAGAGASESSTDVVYSGHCLIAENGKILSESPVFGKEGEISFADVDTYMLEQERLMDKSFIDAISGRSRYRYIYFDLPSYAEETVRQIDPMPFVPSDIKTRDRYCEEIFSIQKAGLMKRISYSGSRTAVIGISGGLDSTLALLATVKTFDAAGLERNSIIGVTMPGFGTTGRTYVNAVKLIKSLGVRLLEIPIADACLQHFEDIGHDPEVHDVTYENTQARERTQILMDIANKEGGLVVGTGDLSEIALGWSTYNGDHMSMYAINSGIPKTLICSLVQWISSSGQVSPEAAEVLQDIIDTPVSPELLPPKQSGEIVQKTEEIVGPYELHDFFLNCVVRNGFGPRKILMLAELAFKDAYSKAELIKWMELFFRRFFSQQFKRSCMPDGPKVGSVALSPRGDWRMPSDASSDEWIGELEELKENV